MDSTLTIISMRTDQEVVGAIRDGKEPAISKAITLLYNHQPFFCNYIINRLINRNDRFNREDTLNELGEIYRDAVVFFMEKVRKGPEGFVVGDKGCIKTYIFRTGKFKYLEKKRKAEKLDQDEEGYIKTQDDVSPDDIFKSEAEERAADVRQAIKELDNECIKLLELRYNEGLTPKDISSQYSKSSNNISQMLLRCRDKLKEILVSKYKFPGRFT